VADGSGEQLRAAVEVMDRLRAPGGCPWDAAQTHRSLAPYLLEETYEVLEALDTGDDAALREELGDLLMQVLFHARIAEENKTDPWSIDDVAADLAAKLRRRHPHVFADAEVAGADEVLRNWEQIKATEKNRTSITDGIPAGLPALALTAKLVARAERAGIDATPAVGGVGTELFRLVRRAVAEGIDPEQALREAAVDYRAALREAEAQRCAWPDGA
jgi:XTP/dITP diphosphohydrolase